MAQDSLWETPAAKTLRVEPGFELDQLDRNSTPGFTGNKADGERLLEERGAVLSDLQELLYANGRSGTVVQSCWFCKEWTPQARAAWSDT